MTQTVEQTAAQRPRRVSRRFRILLVVGLALVFMLATGCVVWWVWFREKPVPVPPPWLTVPATCTVVMSREAQIPEFTGFLSHYVRLRCTGDLNEALREVSQGLTASAIHIDTPARPVTPQDLAARRGNPPWVRKIQLPESAAASGTVVEHRGYGVRIVHVYGIPEDTGGVIEVFCYINL